MPIKSQKSNLTADVYDPEGTVVETIQLPKELFGNTIRPDLLAQAVKVYEANQHLGTKTTKTRGEVAGSTAKLYRQKGTGRARAGSRRAPHRVGGGLAFAHKPHNVKKVLPKKMKRLALLSALTLRWQDRAITFVTGLDALKPKTRIFANVLKSLPLSGKSVLLVIPSKSETVLRGVRNIPSVHLLAAPLLSPYELIGRDAVVVTKDAVAVMEKMWAEKGNRHATA